MSKCQSKGCSKELPPDRKKYCSDRCAEREKKRRYREKKKAKNLVHTWDAVEYAQQVDVIEQEKQKIKEKAERDAYKKFVRGEAIASTVIDELTAAQERVADWKPHKLIRVDKRKSFSDEDANRICSDWQCGELVRPDETGGLAEFNSDIAAKRVETMAQDVYEIIKIQSKSFNVPHLNLWFLGDMMTNELIYRQQKAYVDKFRADQFMFTLNLMTEFILNMLDVFKTVNCYCVVGNHGRLDRKDEGPTWNNWDYLLYKLCKKCLVDAPLVQFQIPKSWFCVADCKGWRFVGQHGEDIKMYHRIPWYGIERDVRDMADMLWDKGQTPPYYWLYAHFHLAEQAELTHGERIMNGSLVGGSLYSVKKLKTASAPSQTFFGVNENRGITWRYNLHLDIPQKGEKSGLRVGKGGM
jgi:hypothetical protein